MPVAVPATLLVVVTPATAGVDFAVLLSVSMVFITKQCEGSTLSTTKFAESQRRSRSKLRVKCMLLETNRARTKLNEQFVLSTIRTTPSKRRRDTHLQTD